MSEANRGKEEKKEEANHAFVILSCRTGAARVIKSVRRVCAHSFLFLLHLSSTFAKASLAACAAPPRPARLLSASAADASKSQNSTTCCKVRDVWRARRGAIFKGGVGRSVAVPVAEKSWQIDSRDSRGYGMTNFPPPEKKKKDE